MNKKKSITADEYLNKVIKRLEDEQFKLKSDISYKGQVFDCAASKIRFEFDKFGFIHKYFFLSKFSALDIETLKGYYKISFSYISKMNLISSARYLMFNGVVCYPVAIVGGINRTIAKFVREEDPPKPIGSFIMPVVYSLESGELCYPEVVPNLGFLYYDEMVFTINAMLA